MKVDLPKIEDEDEAFEWAKNQFPVPTPYSDEHDMYFIHISRMVTLISGHRKLFMEGDGGYLEEKLSL